MPIYILNRLRLHSKGWLIQPRQDTSHRCLQSHSCCTRPPDIWVITWKSRWNFETSLRWVLILLMQHSRPTVTCIWFRVTSRVCALQHCATVQHSFWDEIWIPRGTPAPEWDTVREKVWENVWDVDSQNARCQNSKCKTPKKETMQLWSNSHNTWIIGYGNRAGQ